MQALERHAVDAEPDVSAARVGTISPMTLVEAARAVARAESYWRPLVRHDPVMRWFVRLYGTADVEAWLLTWTEEQSVELHDHGGSSGAILVVEGTLTEDFSDGPLAPLRRVTWPTGSVHSFGPSRVHDIRNVTAAPATSIHVYSPPLTTMTFYEQSSAGIVVPSRVEYVDRAEHTVSALEL